MKAPSDSNKRRILASMLGHVFACFVFCFAAYGQGTDTKPKVEDYPAHDRVGTLSIGADNLGHNIALPERPLLAEGFLVIEVALFNEGNKPFTVSDGQFMLRLNEKKTPLMPQSPGSVSSSIKYPDWEQRPQMTGEAGAGDGQVIFGRPSPVERFPGDPRTQRTPPGGIPRAPDPQDRSGIERRPPLTIDEAVLRASLPEGEVHPPVSGFLYFVYKGKLKSINAIELIYDGPFGRVVIPLP
jgi:hypothetical protein